MSAPVRVLDFKVWFGIMTASLLSLSSCKIRERYTFELINLKHFIYIFKFYIKFLSYI